MPKKKNIHGKELHVYEADSIELHWSDQTDIPYGMYPATRHEINMLRQLDKMMLQRQSLLRGIFARGPIDEEEVEAHTEGDRCNDDSDD